MSGKIHSIETMGTVDGPGIRYVVFFQGCPLRCIYCHNPDTWNAGCGRAKQKSVAQIMEDLQRYRSYFKFSGGGITASGGEPLVQKNFVRDLFVACKGAGIHTCLDTSGFAKDDGVTRELLANTDLVMLDIKAGTPDMFKRVTGQAMDTTLVFARLCAEAGIEVWVRFVLVPGVNDGLEEVRALGDLVKTLPNVTKLEVIRFHQLGQHKWAALNQPYELENTPEATVEQAEAARCILREILEASVAVC